MQRDEKIFQEKFKRIRMLPKKRATCQHDNEIKNRVPTSPNDSRFRCRVAWPFRER